MDGKFEYCFDGYEGQACQKDIEPFMKDLEEVYGIKVLNQTELWAEIQIRYNTEISDNKS